MTDTFSKLQAAYESVVVGKESPTHGIALGSVLNSLTGTKDYIEDRMYLVTAAGVTLIGDEDDE